MTAGLRLPKCIGHRGASAAYPENTLASFERAIADGAHGIETDLHISSDGVIIMFHDAYLDRVTNGKGLIQRQPYLNALDAIQTKKLPSQPLATFDQTIALLTRPENAHVLLNLDIKLDNEPEKLFKLMRGTLEGVPDYQTALAPRIILGLWHPSFLEPAKRLLPECTRSHIGFSVELARRCFWTDCSGFSINFAVLLSPDGAAFRKECEDAGKVLWVWTVNGKAEMLQAARWGVDAIITDKTADYLALRAALENGTQSITDTEASLGYLSLLYYSAFAKFTATFAEFILARRAGQPLRIAASSTLTL